MHEEVSLRLARRRGSLELTRFELQQMLSGEREPKFISYHCESGAFSAALARELTFFSFDRRTRHELWRSRRSSSRHDFRALHGPHDQPRRTSPSFALPSQGSALILPSRSSSPNGKLPFLSTSSSTLPSSTGPTLLSHLQNTPYLVDQRSLKRLPISTVSSSFSLLVLRMLTISPLYSCPLRPSVHGHHLWVDELEPKEGSTPDEGLRDEGFSVSVTMDQGELLLLPLSSTLADLRCPYSSSPIAASSSAPSAGLTFEKRSNVTACRPIPPSLASRGTFFDPRRRVWASSLSIRACWLCRRSSQSVSFRFGRREEQELMSL